MSEKCFQGRKADTSAPSWRNCYPLNKQMFCRGGCGHCSHRERINHAPPIQFRDLTGKILKEMDMETKKVTIISDDGKTLKCPKCKSVNIDGEVEVEQQLEGPIAVGGISYHCNDCGNDFIQK